jgi:predicted  nucleic acid-binding Zn-ribbon protein
MTDTELDERCGACETRLIRTSEDDDTNPHGGDAVTCPSCLELKRVE